MDANRFFSIPFDNRNDVKMRRLRKRCGGFAAYGRWVALLGMLYDENGILERIIEKVDTKDAAGQILG